MSTLHPDLAYRKTRAELINYELMAFEALRSGVPDCYRDGAANTAWGWFLHALSQPMGEQDYLDQTYLFGENPKNLTPPDVMRRYLEFLPLGRAYPSRTQFDRDFADMLLALSAAYRLGARVEAIPAVIQAITGASTSDFTVTEMYSQIGTNGVDASYRNTIRVEVPIGSASSNVFTQTPTMLQDISSALSKCKAAHIGIDLVGRFPTFEDVSSVIAGISDDFTITFLAADGSAHEPVLHLAPFDAPDAVHTVLSPGAVLHLSYQWFKNGEPLVGETTESLTVTPSLADMGSDGQTPATYYVQATDPKLGSVWSKVISLWVVPGVTTGWGTQGTNNLASGLPVPPPAGDTPFPATGGLAVTQQPMARTVRAGSSVTLSVEVKDAASIGVLAPHQDEQWVIESESANVQTDEMQFVDPGFSEPGMFTESTTL